MTQRRNVIDNETLNQLEARLRRGIPAWEHADFIEVVVPQLVDNLRRYLKHGHPSPRES